MKLYKDTKPYGVAGSIVGIFAMITWLVPVVGGLNAILAIWLGVKAFDQEENGAAIAGLSLGLLGLLLTILRSGLVYFYG